MYGEVYAPNVLDSHGNMMFAADVKLLAHRFLRDVVLGRSIDVGHDNNPRNAYPVESFIARKDDPDFRENAWVLGVKIEDETVWADVKAGNLNGFSFEAYAHKSAVVVDVVVEPHTVGETEAGGDPAHAHLYFVLLSDAGKVVGGRTSEVNGHFHLISKGTVTDFASGHNHRLPLQ